MKTYKTILLTAMMILAAACQKAETHTDDIQESGNGLVFSAYLSDTAQSKAYFQNTDGTQHNLVWSGYDCLGIYDYDAALTSAEAELVNGAKSAAASIDSEDRTKATFSAPGEASEWTKTGKSEYYFYAYYPESGESAKSVTGGIVSGFSIPDVQSEGFGKYHLCSVTEPATVQEDGMGSPIALNFTPRTALFSVHTYIAAENEQFSTAGLKSVKATFEGVDGEEKPYYAAGEYSLDLSDGSLSYTANGSKSVTVDMSAYYTTNKLYTAIKKDVETETNVSSTIDIVVLPVEGFTGTVTFEFEALSPSTVIPSVVKNVSGKSFKAGGHYNSDVEINPAIKPLPEANCYIVDASSVTTLMIPLSQGAKGWAAVDKYNNEIVGTSTTYAETYASALEAGINAGILWSENPELSVSCAQYGSNLSVNLSGATNGSNAVIAVRDASDKILWSWHLWFTDYNPDNVLDANTGEVTQGWIHRYKGALWEVGGIYADKYIMDRNLGATRQKYTSAALPGSQSAPDEQFAGLYYQWGRKDPFTINASVTTKTASGAVDLEEGVWNPDTYYTRSDADEDWAKQGSTNNADRWAGKSATVLEKSAFDPCPAGWRVPISYMDESRNKADTWSDFTTSEQFTGREFGFYYRGANNGSCGNASYPVTGRMSRGSFSVALANTGFLWSASPQPDFANTFGCARAFSTPAYVWGDTTTASIQGISRVSAMPVRCIKE